MDCMYMGDKAEDALLKSSRLFGNEELRLILQMRKQYETKIRRKEKPAFLQYIEREKKILEKIRIHSKDDDELLKRIILRITRIYKIALANFKDDLKIWLSYIKFCTEVGNIDLVTESFPFLLQIHTEKRLWHLAAKWEITQCNNLGKALSYLYQGLHFHPTALCLYTHIYKLELSNCNKNKDPDEDIVKKEKLVEKRALNVFDIAKNSIKEHVLYIELLKIASEYKFTSKLQSEISKYLLETFSDKIMVWNTLAQRELEGHHLNNDNEYEFITNTDDRSKYCIEKFESAVEKITTDEMWEKYLNTLLDLYERSNTNTLIKEKFMTACSTAHKKNIITEKQYIVWLECLNNSPEVTEILKTATKKHPNYLQVWMARIRHHFNKKDDITIEKIFKEAINVLGDDSIPVWKRRIQYYQLKGENTNKIATVFREGLATSNKISFALQPMFLEWIALFRSRDILHEIFKELSNRKPICLDMYKKMAELEAMCSKPSEEIFEIINTIMEENPTIQTEWKDYILEEIRSGPTWRKEVYNKYLTPDR